MSTDAVADQGLADRKLARDAIASAVSSADARGVGRRAFLVGLWQSVIGILISAATTHEAILFLGDRTASIHGHGRNADSPPLRLDEDASARRSTEASLAAEVIVGHLELVHEHLMESGREDEFATVVVDAALQLLHEAWGPVHLRRALRSQIDALADGIDAPILPSEPSIPNFAVKTSDTRSRDHDAAETTPPPPRAKFIPGVGRRVEAFIDTGDLGRGQTAVSMAAKISDPAAARMEHRDVFRILNDPGGRIAILEACVDLLESLGPAAEAEVVRIVTTSDVPIKGFQPLSLRHADARLPSEESQWTTLDDLSRDRVVEWILSKPGLHSDLALRADRTLRTAMHEMTDPSSR